MLEDLLQRASLTAETAATLLRRLSTNPWLWGTTVTVTVPTGAAAATVLHGLGHALNGAVVCGQTDATVTVAADSPTDGSVRVRLSATVAYPFIVKLRCF